VGHFLREGVRQGRYTQLGMQLLRSWHVAAFQVPLLPELVLGRLGGPIRSRLQKTQHLDGHWDDASFRADARRGVNLYRANRPSLRRATTSVPVQLIVPTKDPCVTPALLADVGEFAPDLRRIDVVANHWVVRTQPGRVAGAVRTFVQDVSERGAARTGA
jgi:pimeloyl-ACP methyl ester carboxylesterase